MSNITPLPFKQNRDLAANLFGRVTGNNDCKYTTRKHNKASLMSTAQPGL